MIGINESHRLGAAIKVITYLLGTISVNRQREMVLGLNDAYDRLKNKNTRFKEVAGEATAFDWEFPNISQLMTH